MALLSPPLLVCATLSSSPWPCPPPNVKPPFQSAPANNDVGDEDAGALPDGQVVKPQLLDGVLAVGDGALTVGQALAGGARQRQALQLVQRRALQFIRGGGKGCWRTVAGKQNVSCVLRQAMQFV